MLFLIRTNGKGIDVVVSAVGRNVVQEQVRLAKIASNAGVKRFFPSEYGTDIEYGPQSAHEKPHQQKLKVRAAMKQLQAEGSEMSYTYVVTGPFADGYVSNLPFEDAGMFDVKRRIAVLLGDGKGKISLTTNDDTGKLVVAALLHPEASKNRALRVNSYTTTPEEILAEYERQTQSSWTKSYVSLDRLREREEMTWAAGRPSATAYTLRRIWTEGGTQYEKRDNDLIGAETMQTLADTVTNAIKSQTMSS